MDYSNVIFIALVGSVLCLDPNSLKDRPPPRKPYQERPLQKSSESNRFRLDDETIACGTGRPHTLKNITGRFTSPLHPEDYPSNSNCQWSILYSGNTDGRVMVDFTYFDTEYCCDPVYITDGYYDTGIVLAYYRGYYPEDALPDTVISTIYNPGMFLQFTSDPTYGVPGFTALYTADAACIGGQTSNLTGEGEFTSPYYPETFTPNKECRWNVSNSIQQGEVRFNTFNVGTSSAGTCNNAYLYYHTDWDGDHYLCGATIPPAITITSGTVSFRLYVPDTYSPVDGEGFSALYSTYNVTTETTTTSIPSTTTAPPAGGDIEPMPYLSLPSNGSMTTYPYTIDESCNDQYTIEFRNSFELVITQLNDRLSRQELCGYTHGTRLVPGPVDLISQGTTITVQYTTLTTPDDGQVIGDVETCSLDVAVITSNASYWPDPIIPAIAGCPAPILDPFWFDYKMPDWDAYY